MLDKITLGVKNKLSQSRFPWHQQLKISHGTDVIIASIFDQARHSMINWPSQFSDFQSGTGKKRIKLLLCYNLKQEQRT